MIGSRSERSRPVHDASRGRRPRCPWSLDQVMEMTYVIGSGNRLRFAAALVVCLVRELAHELPVFNGTAASFHFFASVGTDHLFGRIGEARCC
jgi:hypothetical protein